VLSNSKATTWITDGEFNRSEVMKTTNNLISESNEELRSYCYSLSYEIIPITSKLTPLTARELLLIWSASQSSPITLISRRTHIYQPTSR
jgi:hypothetical protein